MAGDSPAGAVHRGARPARARAMPRSPPSLQPQGHVVFSACAAAISSLPCLGYPLLLDSGAEFEVDRQGWYRPSA